ncbi:amidohydrolase [Jannaschia sp. M317]|uniref:amidohydrolase family protein n=1 Tax=Jannaschia sp. M317 TaxID=2867011 RepID=UPI0021A28CC3|nr:amidohydrolase family protein [Jannaschia sp. M317]UWQ18043.1 amidohydrolase family protein [Jannaschia sp. M317]
MIIDAHQHFWTLARGDYDWPNDSVAPIFRDFTPGDLRPLLTEAGVSRTVLVQATDSVAETQFLLQIAEATDFVAGVVGWVDLTAPDAIATIELLRAHPALKGLRPMLQGIPDTNWILQDAAQPALAHMARTGLCFDALIQPRHLPVIADLAARHPHLPIVVDHIAKPVMGGGLRPDPDWCAGIATLAACKTVQCKLSGLTTEAGPAWTSADLMPFTQHVLDAFGPARVMFGSDWPVVNLASDYATWIAFVRDLIAPYSAREQADILGLTAQRFYRI